MGTGVLAAAGSTGATTASLSLSANFKTLMHIALKPPAAAATTVPAYLVSQYTGFH
jgi:hypothetical protein